LMRRLERDLLLSEIKRWDDVIQRANIPKQ
jgi:hypothetical protein